ncbi:MAG: hypothetical protein PHV39_04270 [Methanomicrobium sp.]|nr:hypothetical protein [Methanomicrobium sp.]
MKQTIRLERDGSLWILNAKFRMMSVLPDIEEALGRKPETEEDILKGLFSLKAEEVFYIRRPLKLKEFSDGMILKARPNENKIKGVIRSFLSYFKGGKRI